MSDLNLSPQARRKLDVKNCHLHNIAIRRLLLSATQDDRRIWQNGIVLKKVDRDLYDVYRREAFKEEISSNDFVTLTTYSSWFEVHPEKVAGHYEATTSQIFPIKVKGTRKDVEEMFYKVSLDNEEATTKQKAKVKALAITMRLRLLKL